MSGKLPTRKSEISIEKHERPLKKRIYTSEYNENNEDNENEEEIIINEEEKECSCCHKYGIPAIYDIPVEWTGDIWIKNVDKLCNNCNQICQDDKCNLAEFLSNFNELDYSSSSYIKIDGDFIENLLNLGDVGDGNNNEDKNITKVDSPFSKNLEIMEILRSATSISTEFIDDINLLNPVNGNMAELIANLPVSLLALRRSVIQTTDFEYNVKISTEPRVTNQYHSGRCWLFASLNCLRYGIMRKLDVEHKFEFSASYLFFFDKFERANTFLEYMWGLRHNGIGDRYVDALSNINGHIINDGGYWIYYRNLAEKYGLVPKYVYNDSYNCMVSTEMNEILINILNNLTLDLFRRSEPNEETGQQGMTREEFDMFKNDALSRVYALLVKFMGKPPTKFDWRYKNSLGVLVEKKNLTPLKFYNTTIEQSDERKITFIHDPRHPEHYYKPYYIEYAANVMGKPSSYFVNLPLDVFKNAIISSLVSDEPVWFACDVGTDLDSDDGIMDNKRFDYEAVIGESIRFSKADMMTMKTLAPTHAMVFSGVHIEVSQEGEHLSTKKWRVENSWGINCEMEWHPDSGMWQMSDEWFDQNVFMAVIDINHFQTEDLSHALNKIIENKTNFVVLPPWDVFGTVAIHKGCEKCSKYNSKKNK